MKRIIASIFSLMILLSLCSCNHSEENNLTSQNSGESNPASQISTAHAGTRSDPYNFNDDIVITAQSYSGKYTVTYTLNFSEVWGSQKVASEYSNYMIDDRMLARGKISVSCDATEDEIDFNLNPIFITEALTEEAASFQTYKGGELNNHLDTVYADGIYDIIVLAGNDGVGSMDIAYLKINYTNEKGEESNVWIALPENANNELSLDNTTSTDKNSNSLPTSSEAVTMTSAELESVLLEQPMYVEETKYIIQHEEYKALYPDMLRAIIKNNSGTDVKNAVVAFAAWDSNGFPLKLEGHLSFNSNYVVKCNYSDVNMINGATYGENSGLALDSSMNNIETFKAIVVSYEDFDGNTWNNPYYDIWIEIYENKKLN